MDPEKSGSEQMENLVRLEQEVCPCPDSIVPSCFGSSDILKVAEKQFVAVRYRAKGLADLPPCIVPPRRATSAVSQRKESQVKVIGNIAKGPTI